jgi:WD40 repeat protein
MLAVGCMDGSVNFAMYDRVSSPAKTNLTLTSLLNTQVIDNNAYDNSSTLSHPIKHGKFVKNLVWSPSEPILASASSDGTVRLTKVVSIMGNDDVGGGVKTIGAAASMSIDEEEEHFNCNKQPDIVTKHILTLHLPGPVEAMTFLNNGDILCCYVRGTSYLSYFDLRDDCKQTKHSINGGMYDTCAC